MKPSTRLHASAPPAATLARSSEHSQHQHSPAAAAATGARRLARLANQVLTLLSVFCPSSRGQPPWAVLGEAAANGKPWRLGFRRIHRRLLRAQELSLQISKPRRFRVSRLIRPMYAGTTHLEQPNALMLRFSSGAKMGANRVDWCHIRNSSCEPSKWLCRRLSGPTSQ